MDRDLTNVESDTERLRTDYNNLKADVGGLEQTIIELSASNPELQLNLQSVESRNNDIARQLSQLDFNLTRINGELNHIFHVFLREWVSLPIQ